MNKAVIYARYSSDSQTEQSIEGQVRVCREFAERICRNHLFEQQKTPKLLLCLSVIIYLLKTSSSAIVEVADVDD